MVEQDLNQDCWLRTVADPLLLPHPQSSSPSLSAAFPDNPSVLGELCSTLSHLTVRNEFCQEVVDLGGLGILVALLANCNNHQVGIQSCLKVQHPLTLISI